MQVFTNTPTNPHTSTAHFIVVVWTSGAGQAPPWTLKDKHNHNVRAIVFILVHLFTFTGYPFSMSIFICVFLANVFRYKSAFGLKKTIASIIIACGI